MKGTKIRAGKLMTGGLDLWGEKLGEFTMPFKPKSGGGVVWCFEFSNAALRNQVLAHFTPESISQKDLPRSVCLHLFFLETYSSLLQTHQQTVDS